MTIVDRITRSSRPTVGVRPSVASGAALAAGLVADGVLHVGTVAVLCYLVAVVIGSATFVPQAIASFARRELGAGLLMTVAVLGTLALGAYAEAASLALLFSFAEDVGSAAVRQAREGLRAPLALMPESVQVDRDGVLSRVTAADIRVGDTVRLEPGERLATDAVVSSGRSSMDLSALTGASVPVEVGPSSTVLAGSLNGSRVLVLTATASTGDNSLARRVRVLEEARVRDEASQRLADRSARILIPAVLVLAAGLALVGGILEGPEIWLTRALVMLVAAAPCVFVIAAPVTILAAMGAAVGDGIVIKGGSALAALARVRTVALDQAGALTRGRARVVDVIPTAGHTAGQVVAVAAALGAASHHPRAAAIVAAGGHPAPADSVIATAGGLTGIVDGQRARIWRAGAETGDASTQALEADGSGSLAVAVGLDDRMIGTIVVRDGLRLEAPAAVAALREAGHAVVMLSEDDRATAASMAALAGIERLKAGVRPSEQPDRVEALRVWGPVAMVGDGVVDAPALEVADVGIAMGATGSDRAIDAADVALVSDDLLTLPVTLAHARRAATIMRQNLLLATVTLVVLVPAGMFGWVGLTGAALAHELAEIIIVANGLRAGRRATLEAHRDRLHGAP